MPLTIAENETSFLSLRLSRLGSIGGTLLDENDVGLPEHDVVAYRNTKPPQIAAESTSDDRGIYRLSGLEPGVYLVRSVGKHYEEEIGLRNPEIVGYVAHLLTEFCESDQLFKLRNASGRQLDDVAEMLLESDPIVTGSLGPAATRSCRAPARRPHIVMVLDESSFDITAAPGIKVPPGYRDHFRSFDGKTRSLLVEATGGPTWYSEYNVLTGLSARSYGRFMFNVTRIAAGRVQRGLPQVLRRCGYKTFSLYPAYGGFLGARRFQTTAGIERFTDLGAMGVTSDMQPDRFYLEQALRLLERERGDTPLFIFVYVMANHWCVIDHQYGYVWWAVPDHACYKVPGYVWRQIEQRWGSRDREDAPGRLEAIRPVPYTSFERFRWIGIIGLIVIVAGVGIVGRYRGLW